ncbi:MAG TPA: hypothetical protein VK475_01930 [Pyrinomonadaceae bacterium]|nr:hypothetical protein [Pyrinomonadaceae bacterium]
MARFRNPLDQVQVAAPCPADWNQMLGSERVRFCGQCSLNVYNLSSMTKAEAEHLIARTEGRLCVRFYRRRDGSIITKNCPVGLRAVGRRVSYIAKAVVSMVLGLFAGLGVHEAFSNIAPFRPQVTTGQMVREVELVQGMPVAEEGRVEIGKAVLNPRRRIFKARHRVSNR